MRLPFRPQSRSAHAIAAGATTAAILVADSATDFEIAVGALYVVVVLIVADFLDARSVRLVALGCMMLAVVSHLATRHGDLSITALANLFISLALIGLTSYLALQTKSAHAAIREQAALIDLTHDSIFVRGMDDVIRFWNRGSEELYGWTREEAVGRVCHELMRTVFPLPIAAITKALLRSERWEGHLIHTKRDGSKVIAASRWSLQRDDRGRPLAVLETNNDVTGQRRAEEALQATQTELAHANRVTTLGELAASIAHEVNQPLSAIVTNGEVCLRLLRRDPPDLAEVRDGIEAVITNGMRASDVVRKLRTLYQRSEPQKARLDLAEVIGDVVALMARELSRSGATLRQELTPDLSVVGDRVQIQQVVLNLIMNAAEALASFDGPSELTVRSRPAGPGEIAVDVEDSGPGIDPAVETSLFTPFFTTKPGGMGMGLAICRSIVELHGGRLWVTPKGGQGAAFHFTLPGSERAEL